MTIEVHESVEAAMHWLDWYILVGYRNGYPVTEMSGSPFAWKTRDVRCYKSLGAAKGMRTRVMKSRDGYANRGLEVGIRILHVHVDLVAGTSTTEWVE